MSLSGDIQTDALHLAIRRSVSAGIVYTAAAGNFARDVALEVPGSYPEVLTVTAVADSDGAPGGAGPAPCEPAESDDRYASFSNFATAPTEVAHVVAAPGVCISSTGPRGGEMIATGTSAAAPHVAGVVALCMGEPGRPGACAEMTPAEVTAQVLADAAANTSAENGFAGDPFRPVGVHFGHLVSAADPALRRISPRPPSPVPAAATPPARVDRRVEVLTLRIARRQDVDALGVVVRLAEAGTVTARARVALRRGAARVIASRPATAAAAAHRTVRLRLRLRRAGLRAIKRALRRGGRVRARVTVTVSDPAGNARTRTRRVRLRP
jgi:subtilisin family serine protease